MLHESRKTPRARRHDANLQRILDAATQMIAESGLDALSMSKLAEAVDYTPGALYRYFGSKDALLSQIVEKILEDVRMMLDRAEAQLSTNASPLARVFALVQGYRAFARLHPHRFGLLAVTMADPRVLLREAEHAAPVVRVMVGAMQRLSSAIGEATEAGLLSPGESSERTICLFAMLQGLLQLQKQARYAPSILDIDALTIQGTAALLRGWGAKARTVEAAIARVASLGDLTKHLAGAA